MSPESRPTAIPALDLSDPETRYRLVAESSTDVIWVMDLSLRTIYMSPSVEYQLGYSPQEYTALSLEERLPPESIAIVRRFYGEVQAELAAHPSPAPKITRKFEMLHRHRDGRLLWGEVSISLLLDEAGRPCGFHGITRDISERKGWERALQESEEKYRRLVELLPLGVFECDLEGRLLFCNDTLYRMAGYDRQGPLPELWVPSFMAPEEWPRIQTNMARLLAGERVSRNDYQAVHADGSRYPIEVHATVVLTDGLPTGFRGVIIDVSEKRRYEEELFKSNKLAAVGLLAGGIAHDFNNILAAVMGNINLAALESEDDPVIARFLQEAEKAILRARGLTQQLLTFSRGGVHQRELARAADVVREIAPFYVTGSAASCEIRVEGEPPNVLVDLGQFGQVIQNLVINAVQAMPGGGRVRIRLSRHLEPDGDLPGCGEYFRMDVDDDGPGVPLEIRDRVFDPYFTTKPTGTGLGLAVSLAILRNHGGDLRVDDAPEGGARFIVLLPAAAGTAGEERGRDAPSRRHRDARLLFVDDEASLRRLASELGAKAGYRVDTAESAESALAAWERARASREPYDLLILDLTLQGGMGGAELFEHLRRRDSSVRAVVSSGYVEDPALIDWRGRGFAAKLQKPYGLPAFTEAVETALTPRPLSASCE